MAIQTVHPSPDIDPTVVSSLDEQRRSFVDAALTGEVQNLGAHREVPRISPQGQLDDVLPGTVAVVEAFGQQYGVTSAIDGPGRLIADTLVGDRDPELTRILGSYAIFVEVERPVQLQDGGIAKVRDQRLFTLLPPDSYLGVTQDIAVEESPVVGGIEYRLATQTPAQLGETINTGAAIMNALGPLERNPSAISAILGLYKKITRDERPMSHDSIQQAKDRELLAVYMDQTHKYMPGWVTACSDALMLANLYQELVASKQKTLTARPEPLKPGDLLPDFGPLDLLKLAESDSRAMELIEQAVYRTYEHIDASQEIEAFEVEQADRIRMVSSYPEKARDMAKIAASSRLRWTIEHRGPVAQWIGDALQGLDTGNEDVDQAAEAFANQNAQYPPRPGVAAIAENNTDKINVLSVGLDTVNPKEYDSTSGRYVVRGAHMAEVSNGKVPSVPECLSGDAPTMAGVVMRFMLDRPELLPEPRPLENPHVTVIDLASAPAALAFAIRAGARMGSDGSTPMDPLYLSDALRWSGFDDTYVVARVGSREESRRLADGRDATTRVDEPRPIGVISPKTGPVDLLRNPLATPKTDRLALRYPNPPQANGAAGGRRFSLPSIRRRAGSSQPASNVAAPAMTEQEREMHIGGIHVTAEGIGLIRSRSPRRPGPGKLFTVRRPTESQAGK